MSMFVGGSYFFDDEIENVILFGKYDNDIFKKIKIIHIPLNWLVNSLISRENVQGDKYKTELSKIPPIGIDNKKAKYFRVQVYGNPNKKNTNVDVKLLKLK